MQFGKVKIFSAALLLLCSTSAMALSVNYNKSTVVVAVFSAFTTATAKVQLTFRDNTNTLRVCTGMQSEISLDAVTAILVTAMTQDPDSLAGKVNITCSRDSIGSLKLTGILYNK